MFNKNVNYFSFEPEKLTTMTSCIHRAWSTISSIYAESTCKYDKFTGQNLYKIPPTGFVHVVDSMVLELDVLFIYIGTTFQKYGNTRLLYLASRFDGHIISLLVNLHVMMTWFCNPMLTNVKSKW